VCGYIQNPWSLSLIYEEKWVSWLFAILDRLEVMHTEFYLVPTVIYKKLLFTIFSLHFVYLGLGK